MGSKDAFKILCQFSQLSFQLLRVPELCVAHTCAQCGSVPSHSTCLLPPQALADNVVRTIDHDLTRCKPQIECAESNGGGKKCGFCFCRARDRPKIEKLPSTVQTWVVRPANAIPMQGEQAQASLVLLTISFCVGRGARRVFCLKGRPILRILILKHIVLFFFHVSHAIAIDHHFRGRLKLHQSSIVVLQLFWCGFGLVLWLVQCLTV